MKKRTKLSGSNKSTVTREELKLMFEASESRMQTQVQVEMLKLCDSITKDMKCNFQSLTSTYINLVNSKPTFHSTDSIFNISDVTINSQINALYS